MTNAIANFSGLKTSSVSSLLSLAAPVALANLGKEAEAKNMNTSDFLGFLNGQKESIMGSIPSGLNIASAFGLSSLSNIGSRLSGESGTAYKPQAAYTSEMVEEKKGTPWLVPLILILAGAGLLWWLFGGKNKKEETAVNSTVTMDTLAAHVI